MALNAAEYASEAMSLQLKFMSEAAHLLALSAPGCSSHIMSSRDTIMFANDIGPSDAHRRHACGGCGAIKIPSWTVDVAKEAVVKMGKKKMTGKQLEKLAERAKASPAPGAMVDICRRCHRKTRQSILKPAPHRTSRRQLQELRPPPNTTTLLPQAPSTLTSTAAVPTTNTSSKKRSKSRKQGGLQALLAKNKEASQSKGFGLDLMDLMK